MSQAYYQRNRDQRLSQMKEYYGKTKDLHSARMKKYRNRDTYKEQSKRYTEKYLRTPENKFNVYCKDAQRRGITWNLSFKEFMLFWQKPCVVCDCAIETIGLDRIDNNRGYSLDNVRPMCKKHNYMRNKYSDEDIIELATGLSKWKGS